MMNTFTDLTDTYLMYAASAVAANTVARSAAGAAAPLFTNYMFTALGVGPGGSIVAGVGCLLAPAPFLFYKYGRPIRERSKFAPTAPKQADAPVQQEGDASSTDEEEERGLDETMGLPDQKDLEKEGSGSSPVSPVEEKGDRFLDASGLEKAER